MNKKHATINNYVLGKTLGSGYQAKVTHSLQFNVLILFSSKKLCAKSLRCRVLFSAAIFLPTQYFFLFHFFLWKNKIKKRTKETNEFDIDERD